MVMSVSSFVMEIWMMVMMILMMMILMMIMMILMMILMILIKHNETVMLGTFEVQKTRAIPLEWFGPGS